MLSHRGSGNLAPSRVVVLGATGFVAGTLISLLRSENISCRPVGSREVDLTQAGSVTKLRAIVQERDSIVVTSALTPEHGRDRPTFMKNVRMVETLCAVLALVPCTQVVYISSDSVYDSRCVSVNEDSCCETGDMYGLGHLVREKLLQEACQGGDCCLSIVRPSAIYGAEDTHDSYGPNRFLRSALRDGKITLFGRGEEERDHIYIDDVCEIIRLCLFYQSSGVLNSVSGQSLSFAEVARRIIDAVPCAVTVETVPRQRPITNRQYDTSALRRAFPEFQSTPFGVGIRQMMQSHIQRNPGSVSADDQRSNISDGTDLGEI